MTINVINSIGKLNMKYLLQQLQNALLSWVVSKDSRNHTHQKTSAPQTAWCFVFILFAVVTSQLSAQPFAYITNSTAGSVTVINTANNSVVTTIAVGTTPFGVAVKPDGSRVYVANNGSGTVSVINTSTNTVVGTIPVGSGVSGLAVSPDGSRVYATRTTANAVSVIDTSDNSIVTTITSGFNSPLGVVVNTAGTRVFVTNNVSPGTVSVINTSTNALLTPIALTPASAGNSPYGIAVSPDGAFIYVVNGGSNDVVVINATTGAIITTFTPSGIAPLAVAINPASTRAYITNFSSGSVTVVDTTTHTVLTTISIGAVNLNGISINPAGTFAYVADQTAQNVRVINLSTNMLSANIAAGGGASAFGQFIGPAPMSGACQFIPTMGAWNVAANWGGACASPNRVPGALDRAEIVNKQVSLPIGTTTVGDLYLLNASIFGQNGNFTDVTLDVVAANNIAGGIAWGSGSYTFVDMTLQLRATGTNPVPAANGPLDLNTARIQLFGKGANFGAASTSAVYNNSIISTNDSTAILSLNGNFNLNSSAKLSGRIKIVTNLSVGLLNGALIDVESVLNIGAQTLTLTGAGLAGLQMLPGSELKSSGGTLAGGSSTLTFPNDMQAQRLVSGNLTIVGGVANASATLRPRPIITEMPSASISITGSYTQSGAGKLNLYSNFANNNAAVVVTGVATLGGELAVEIEQPSSIMPPATIASGFSYGSRVGVFNTVSILPGTAFTPIYGATNVDINLLAAGVFISPSTHAYANTLYGNFATQTFTVTNNSGATSTISNTTTAFTGTNPADFAVFADNCSSIVADGASCTIVIHFLPLTHPVGLKEANFGITINNQTAVATLSGTTVSPAGGWLAPDVSGTIVIPGPTPAGAISSADVTLYNVGGAPVSISSITSAPPLSSNFSSCSTPIAPSASCSVPFIFSSSGAGQISGQYFVESNIMGNNFNLFASAEGTNTLAPTVVTTVSSATISLGGTTTATLTITNPNASITLNTVNVTSLLTVGQLQVALTPNTSTTCSGMPEITAFPGANSASISIFAMAPLSSCTFSYDLKSSNTTGVWTVGSNAISSTEASANVINGFVNVTVASLPTPSPTSLSFGNVSQLSVSTPQSITISNTNASALAITNLNFSNSNFAFTTTMGCNTSVPAMSACVYDITFIAPMTGSYMANFNIVTPLGTISVPMSGTSTTFNVSVTAAPMMGADFGSVVLGANSATTVFTYTNNGVGSANITSAAIFGGNATDFTLVSTTCMVGTFLPSATCTANVRFNPTSSVGAKNSIMRLVHGSANNDAAISGIAIAAAVGVSPTSFNFGNVTVNTVSASQTFTITNNTGVAAIPAVFVPSPFTNIGTGTCGPSLAALASCTYVIAFAPTIVTTSNGNITFNVGATVSAPTALVGTGVAAPVAPVITSAPTLPSGTISVVYSTTLTATGSPTITWSQTAGTMPPGLSLSLAGVISGTPTATGVYNFTIQAANGTMPNASQMVSLTIGNGLSFAPANLVFGNTALGTASTKQIVTLTNTTNAAITITMTGNTPGEFGHYLPSCGMSIPALGNCTIEVDFSPSVMSMLGAYMGSLTITTPSGNLVVPLSGNAVAYNLTNGGNLAFANTVIAQTSANQTVTYTNSTTGTANVLSVGIVGIDAAHFQLISNTCTLGPVNAMATCTATARFAPTTIGPKTASIQLIHAGFANFSVGLSGTAIAAPIAPVITSAPALPAGTVGTPYTTTLVASGTPASTWSVTTGAVPAGLVLNSVTGIINGTPTAAGTFNFTIQAANGTTPNASQMVSITIAAGMGTIPAITSAAPPSGQTGQGYSFTPSATGSPTIAWSIASGGLPPGLTLSPTTGTITGTPSTAGSFVFTLRATNMAGQANQATSITIITPITPTITVSPAILNFGNQNLGIISQAQAVTVTNSGNGPFNINSITSIGDFAYTSNCPATLNPQASCTLNFTFSPLTAGPLTGLASVNTTALAGSGSISLNGTGVSVPRANIVINPASLTFGDQAQGTASAAQIIFISNTGLATLELRSISLIAGSSGGSSGGSGTPSFSLGAPPASDNPNNLPSCGGALAPATSCALGVRFSPPITTGSTGTTGTTSTTSGIGNQSASITITHNSTPTGTEGTSVISLNGNATLRREALIRLTGQPSFADQVLGTVSAPQTISVTNTGTIDLTVGALSISPTNTNSSASDFQVSAGCGTLIPNANCLINVSFSPTASIGSKAATLNVASNASNASAGTTSLSGNAIAVPAPVVRLSATSLGFGTAIVGGASSSQALTLTNAGGLPLSITSIVSSGGEYSQTNNCPIPPASLNPMQSCSINITFKPLGLSGRVGSLSITSNATPSTNIVPLTGTGCRFLTAQQQRLFVTNCGGE
jgi:YVTN family beta-propeller protein